MTLRRILALAAVSAAALVAVLLGLVAIAYGALQTETGKGWLAATVEGALSGPDATARIEGLDGHLPFKLRVGYVALADTGGTWLEIENARLDWRPLALLGGRFHVTTLSADRIELLREPAAGDEPPPEPSDEPFEIPKLPVAVRVDTLSVPRIAIGEALLGTAVALRAQGQIQAEETGRIATRLSVDRLDGETGGVSLDAVYERAPETLEIHLTVLDQENGLVAHLAGMPDLPSLSLKLDGAGPVSDWTGQLVARAGDAGLDADIALAAQEIPRFALDGTLRPGGFLPPEARPFATPEVTVSLAGQWNGDDGILGIDHAGLSSQTAEATLSGSLDTGASTVDATLDLRLPDGAALSDITAPARIGALAATVHATGPLATPRLRVDGEVTSLAISPVAADRLRLQGDAEPAGDGAWTVDATLASEGFTADTPALAELAGTGPALSLRARVEGEGARLALEEARLDLAAGEVAANGTVAPDPLDADIRLTADLPDLSRLAGVSGLAMDGRASLDASLQARGESLSGEMALESAELSTGIPALDALLGAAPRLSAALEHPGGGGWTVRDVTLDAANAGIAASAEFPDDFSQVTAEYRIELPRLAALSEGVGTPMSGALTARGRAEGPIASPAIDLAVRSDTLSVAGQSLSGLTLEARAEDPAGRLDARVMLQARHQAGPLSLSSDIAMADGRLSLDDLVLDAPGARLAGTVDMPLDGAPATGRIAGTVSDASPLAGAFGQSVAGRAGMEAVLVSRDGAQGVDLDADVSNLSYGPGPEPISVDSLTADLAVTLAPDGPRIDASARASGIAAAPASLDTLTLTASGNLADLRFEAATEGEAGVPVTLSLAGALDLDGTEQAYAIQRLDGTLADRALTLTQPLRIAIGPQRTTLDPFALTLGEGRLEGRATLGPREVDATLTLAALPANFANLFVETPILDGALDGSLRLSGDPAAPQGSLTLSSTGLTVRSAPRTPPQPFDLSLDARLTPGRLEGSAGLTGNGNLALDARYALPVRVSLNEGDFGLVEDGPLSGRLTVEGNADALDELVSLDPHRLSGRIDVRADLSGTPANPIVEGRAGLSGGGYENLETGTVLADMNVTAELERTRARLSGSATDTESGRIDLSGEAVFAQKNLQATVNLRQATLVRRDDVTATASGNIEAAGWIDDLAITGEIVTDRVEVRLIDNLPPNVVSLDVTEIGEGAPPPAEEEEEAGSPMTGTIDLTVRIPGRLFVRGRGLDSEWEGRIAVTGTFAKTAVNGELRPVRGQLSFAGKTFVLQQGTIRLDQRGDEVAVVLDLGARFEGEEGFSALVRISGTADNPQIDLSSTPSLPRDEIISRILFGRGTGNLSALEALQLAEAVGSLSGTGGSTGILDKVRETLGVDVLRVGTGEEGNAPSVTAGKYIADGVFVGAKQGAGPGTTGATVEIEITPRISVEGDAQTQGSGVGVKWRYDY